MSQAEAARAPDRTASDVCRRYAPSEEASALLSDELTPRQFLDRLVAAGRLDDASRFLSHVLPKRAAVWWGVLCVGPTLGDDPPPAASEALGAARAWALDPSEANRRSAFAAAEGAGIATAAGSLALAAYFSGGSLSLPDLPAVPPPDHLTADSVANALTLAAFVPDPRAAPEKSAAFLRAGIDVATGDTPWPGGPG